MTSTVAGFRIPRSWDQNAPKFTSDNHDDLAEFLDQVAEIIDLGKITDEDAKKKLLTSYVPMKKRELWREIPSYKPGTGAANSYEQFVKDVKASYPELEEDKKGKLSELQKLCLQNDGITASEPGKLKRFGRQFVLLANRLMAAPIILLNKEACTMYLNTLDPSFSLSLRMAIATEVLMKGKFQAATAQTKAGTPGGAAMSALSGDARMEDPVSLRDLIDMAETMAGNGTLASHFAPGIHNKAASTFSISKVTEQQDKRLEAIEEELANSRDAREILQKQMQSNHEEMMKRLESASRSNVRDAPPHMNLSGSGDASHIRSNWNQAPNRGQCFYCEGLDHYSKDCPMKALHYRKKWLKTENGKQRLGDGNLLPTGSGPLGQRVEDYWAKKNSRSTYAYMDDDLPWDIEDTRSETDILRDEVRTLQTKLYQHDQKLNQVSTPVQSPAVVVQPTALTSNSKDDVARAFMSFMMDQFVTTRSGKNISADSGQDF
uniref:CCHC-type domain-containing protein n=1 Tax=Mycena chlorophos TaxID=658473 RepID=A0ABQ0KTX2_MYCCL|nr:predicted protein [Mycena chlorophos]